MKYILIVAFVLAGCTPVKVSNFEMETVGGWDLDGKRVELKNLPHQRFALNFYSPTCVPCVKELPALNFLHGQLSGNEVAVYIAVDPYVIVENDAGTLASVVEEATAIMKKEVVSRQIKLPVIILDKKIVGQDGLVTGTPETLLLETRPLSLYYNFIGAITEEQNPAKISQDNKVKFLTKMLGR